MAAGPRLSGSRDRRRSLPVRLALAVLLGHLARVDEVLQLFLVLIRIAVGRVALHAALLGEVLERGPRVSLRAKAELASCFRRRQRATPAQQVEELRRQERDAGLADRERGQLETEGGKQRSMQLARRIDELREGLRTRRRDVVRTGWTALGREDYRRHAVVSMDQLQRW